MVCQDVNVKEPFCFRYSLQEFNIEITKILENIFFMCFKTFLMEACVKLKCGVWKVDAEYLRVI